MRGLGESIREGCLEEGRVKGREEGRLVGIQVLIQDNLEEQVPRERTLLKLQKYFDLEEEKAEEYYEKFTLLSE